MREGGAGLKGFGARLSLALFSWPAVEASMRAGGNEVKSPTGELPFEATTVCDRLGQRSWRPPRFDYWADKRRC